MGKRRWWSERRWRRDLLGLLEDEARRVIESGEGADFEMKVKHGLVRVRIDPVRPWQRSARTAAEIEANPEEKARMERSQRAIDEGRVRWER